MADSAACASTTPSTDDQELKDIREIVWGANIRLDVFRRWSQGLETFALYPPTSVVSNLLENLIHVRCVIRGQFASNEKMESPIFVYILFPEIV